MAIVPEPALLRMRCKSIEGPPGGPRAVSQRIPVSDSKVPKEHRWHEYRDAIERKLRRHSGPPAFHSPAVPDGSQSFFVRRMPNSRMRSPLLQAVPPSGFPAEEK